MGIFECINSLITYGIEKKLIESEDAIYVQNGILEKLNLSHFEFDFEIQQEPINHVEVLKEIIEYAYSKGIIESINPPFSDLFDTSIMGLMVPMPSVINKEFYKRYKESKRYATDYFYSLSKASNYIRMDRIDKNVCWSVNSEYGKIMITINLSKPEKDPKAIALGKNLVQTGYPKCLLCYENVGFQGDIDLPARQNHRVIPIELKGEKWYFQYSPYVYFNEHSIVFKKDHQPMKIDKSTFARLLDFVDLFPHYFIGSNSDLPIVGGSMLSHDHYQSGNFEFPMEQAESQEKFDIKGFEDVEVTSLKWPLTVLRLKSNDRNRVLELADRITEIWRGYSDEEVGVFATSIGENHNTVTPIVRRKNNKYEIDIVLRNNKTSKEFPDGIFHPHIEIHPIKKENIGLIEVMGLAVLPSRLKIEIELLNEALLGDKKIEDLKTDKVLCKYEQIYELIKQKYTSECDNSLELIKSFVGEIFIKGLEHSGVFKNDNLGRSALRRFVDKVDEGMNSI